MPILTRCLLFLLLAFSSTCAIAQSNNSATAATAPSESTAQTLNRLSAQLDSVKSALKKNAPDLPLADLRGQALSVQDQSRDLASSLAPQMAALQAQQAVLGPAPEKGQPAEAAEVSSQRRQLDKTQANLDAQIKQAQLLNQNALQLAAQITGLRNDRFQAQLASRTATPFSRAFWVDPIRALPDDAVRIKRLGLRWRDAWNQATQPPNRQPLLWCLIAAAALLLLGRWLLERLWLLLAIRYLPEGHLRRSAIATVVALTAIFTAGMAAELVHVGLNWNDVLDTDLDTLASTTVRLVCFAAFVTGLGRALLSVRHPSWRLPKLCDLSVRRLRPFPWLLGASALLLGMVERISRTIGSSLAATVATHGIIALVISGLIGTALLRFQYAQRNAVAADGAAEADIKPVPRPVWVGVLTSAIVFSVCISWLGVATGFIALAYFVAVQTLWIGVIIASLYLLINLTRDVFETLLSSHGPSGKRLQTVFGVAPGTLDQATAILSGISRIALALFALAIVLKPFGAGPGDLWANAMQTLSTAKLGNIPIEPGTVLKGVLVFVLGLIALHVLKRWMREQLLPNTTMESGMQDSLVTLLGYLGSLLVFVLTLVELKVDLKSITWIVSALSVGIGFGLQAIVQNFISGLILLIERPVKVGDWVSLNGVEGDIRRINVRATEIQMGDRSTVIVPNSQLITENVRNVTHANAQGRVLITLPMPLDTNASKARTLILDVLNEHPGTLLAPAPVVRLADIDAGSMTFNCIAYVTSPREVGGVKSDLLFEILQRLRDAQLPLTRSQNMLVRNLPPLVDSPEEHD
ncbi:MAG: DUF3772 domain-containing protein [Rhodanobacter sp.]